MKKVGSKEMAEILGITMNHLQKYRLRGLLAPENPTGPLPYLWDPEKTTVAHDRIKAEKVERHLAAKRHHLEHIRENWRNIYGPKLAEKMRIEKLSKKSNPA